MPANDGDFLPDRLGKEQKRSSRVPILAVILVAVLMLCAIAGLMIQVVNNREPHPSIPVRTSAGMLYATHSPISIVGNGGFVNASGVVWGSGTAADPYIITDWDISPSVEDGILIRDTDAHFIVRNCYVHDGAFGGISLSNCVNGSLTNNRCLLSGSGIVLDESSNNTLSDNNCLYDGGGIVLGSSSNNNILIDNNCSSNGYDGIFLSSSSNNLLSNNNCSLNVVGAIELRSSNNNTLINNACSSNNRYGIYLEASGNNNEISRNLVSNNAGYGVDILSNSNGPSGSNNRIWNNTFIGNNGATDTYVASHAQAFDGGTHNWWNSTNGYGNWWSDWQSPDIVRPYGIVDLPYKISGRADVGSRDYYPLTTMLQEPHTGIMLFVAIAFVVAIVVVIVFVVAIVLIREARRRKAQ